MEPRHLRCFLAAAPGPTGTAMIAAASDEVRETLAKRIPLGRMGRADEVACGVGNVPMPGLGPQPRFGHGPDGVICL